MKNTLNWFNFTESEKEKKKKLFPLVRKRMHACMLTTFFSRNSLTTRKTDPSMHDNDASNGGSSFRLIVNNAIMTLKKLFDFNVEHVLNFIHTKRRTNDIFCVGSYKNSRKKVIFIDRKINRKIFFTDDRYLFMVLFIEKEIFVILIF